MRTVSTAGIIQTIAGTGSIEYLGENLAATSSNIGYPTGLSIDSSNGDLYISVRVSLTVMVLTATSKKLSTFAGTFGFGDYEDGVAATSCNIAAAEELSLGSTGRLYIASFDINRVSVVYSSMPTAAPTPSPSSVRSSQNAVYVIAGTGDSASTGSNGPATSASVNLPRSIWGDSLGYLFITEYGGNCVRKISTVNKIISDVAGVCGATGAFDGDGGSATAAHFTNPMGAMADTQGRLYVTDYSVNRVRLVYEGSVTTMAGTGNENSNGNSGPATSADLSSPFGVWVDTSFRVYISESNVIRRVDTDGIITRIIGNGETGTGGEGGPATSAQLYTTKRIFIDSCSLIYFVDNGTGSRRVRKVNTDGIISVIAGNADSVYNGEGLAATVASFYSPMGVWVDSSNGDMYVSSYLGMRIQVLTGSTRLVTTFAGTGLTDLSDDGEPATSSGISRPDGIFVDSVGLFYVATALDRMVRVIISTSPTMYPTITPTNPPSVAPTLLPTAYPSRNPTLVPSVSPSVAPSLMPSVLPSQFPSVLPSLAPSSIPTVIPSSMPIIVPSILPTLSPTSTPSVLPSGLPSTVSTSLPTLFPSISPSDVPSVRPTGSPSTSRSAYNVVSTAVGSGSDTASGACGTCTLLNAPSDVWEDSVGDLYFTEQSCVRKLSSFVGIVISYAGDCAQAFISGDGGPATAAQMSYVVAIFGDSGGKMYIVDNSMNRVRMVSSAGIITTFAGSTLSGTSDSGDDGPATSAELGAPYGVWVNTVQKVYISLNAVHRIRVVGAGGIITLVAGNICIVILFIWCLIISNRWCGRIF